jgi:hypothetical protein
MTANISTISLGGSSSEESDDDEFLADMASASVKFSKPLEERAAAVQQCLNQYFNPPRMFIRKACTWITPFLNALNACPCFGLVIGDIVIGDIVIGDIVIGDVVIGDIVIGDVVIGDVFASMDHLARIYVVCRSYLLYPVSSIDKWRNS